MCWIGLRVAREVTDWILAMGLKLEILIERQSARLR